MDPKKLISELQFKAVRSSGAGGQHVNKVSSKAVLSFDVANSAALNEEEKMLIESKLATRLNRDKIIVINCDEDRSQIRNKDIAAKRLLELIEKALLVPKPRKPTKVPKSVIKKRLKDKKNLSETKQFRKKPDVG